ncbi:hypothetical protein [Roseibium sp. RKSG952]|uniref:hypothetical protein n=1 Tax=Roseibium sp. RKSG952 TaxID=2529384 RepID=UPI0012BBF1B9|nr:hypothetical protein [Roseibium sp. RKSG952]MTH96695.1 hypothetical protein [Roseibium sp. RKSG952]
MSIFVNDAGTPKIYAIVDEASGEVVSAIISFGSAEREKKNIEAETGRKLAIFNLTHPRCPKWILDIAWADEAYCLGQAAKFDHNASVWRKKADKLIKEAEQYESTADGWRARAEAAATIKAPKM